ncbi:hypothetical protein ACJIZ3_006534 [Penstemon smallii]|uniref:Uncharacterized protein n=1 Tax=Penstemon smallii TaxID=265156 RepID=A0ABD3S806_9LAMI
MCQSLTPWTGSGPKLGPTVSVCDSCFGRRSTNVNGDRDLTNGNTVDEDENDDDDDDDEEEEVEDDDDGENQVVPLSLPPSLDSSSSGSEESSSSSSKREVETSRFPYNGIEKPEEKKGPKNIRSWKWR